ncbi:MAG: hypothetical protein PSV16_00460 [Flavobacterium sp.]|nr:hypothetical protein [Flavobacterium sp.]
MQANQSKIALNFFELSPKNFFFKIYYKSLEEIVESERRNHYIVNLKEEDASPAIKVAVSFEEQEGFISKILTQDFDFAITKQFIFHAFQKHISSKQLRPIENLRDKYHRIYLPLQSYPEGIETIWLEPYYLKQNKSFGFLIDFRFSVNQEYQSRISGSVDKKILQLSGTLDAKGYSNKAYYQFKFDKLKTFIAKYFAELQTFSFQDIDFSLSEGLTQIHSNLLSPKTYQFHNDAENPSSYVGLQKNLPFQNPEKPTKYLFVFKDSDRNIAINLLRGLQGVSSPNTFAGIEKLFKIPFNNDCIRGKKVDEISTEVLNEIVQEVQKEREDGINLLPIILTNSKETDSDDKLYFKIKHTFTKNDIACQVVTKELVNNSNSLKWSLSNIGLQIFAKAGGKPWKVKPAIKECLIIGIGSKNKEVFSIDEHGIKRKKIEKYLTYSVLTDSSGLFKEIQILSETDNETDYYKSLVTKLGNIILQAIQDGNKDIVIHTPFRISKAKVWDVLFKTIPTGINISILLINSAHKYFGYDFSKNALVPYESSFIALSEYEYLVWFEGLQFNNAPFSKPIGSPIYIDFWYANNRELLYDQNYRRSLLQDCINLSGANWRGFKAKQLPVSIFYCQKIADFLKKFEDYELEHIEFQNLKPWFL